MLPGAPGDSATKDFCFFFSKKKAFLAGMTALTRNTAPLGLLSPKVMPEEKLEPLGLSMMLGIAGVILAAILSSLDQRIATSAMADLLGGLGLGRDEGSWVNTAYAVGDIAVVPLTPWLAQIVSPRRLAAGEIVLFVVAAAACPLAANYNGLIALRFLQGFGEGGLVPLMLLTLLQATPPRHRPEAFAVYAAVSTLAPLMAESLGGVATDLFTWQSLFWFSAALGPVALFLVLAFLPVQPPKWEKFVDVDYFGLACLVAFCCLLVTGLSQGQRLDWFDDRFIVAMFAGAAMALVGFLVSEWLAEYKLLDLALFRRPNFSIGLCLVGVFNIGLLGATYVEPQTQMLIRALKPIQIGQLFLLLAAPQLIVAPITAVLMRFLDARLLVGCGFAMGALGACLCTYVTSAWAGTDFLAPLLLQACGWPLAFTPLVFLTTSVLKPEDALSGGTIFNIVRTLAISAGPAIVGAVITVRERVHSDFLVQHLVAGRPGVDTRVAASGLGALVSAERAQAYVLAFADAFGWLSVLLLIGLVLVVFEREAPVTRKM